MSVNIYHASSDTLQVVAGAADVMATPAYTTMPIITSAMVGQIVQYVGMTNANYTQGYFYIASSDEAAEPTYSWVNLATQDGYSETVLYKSVTNDYVTNITLSDDWRNYDVIVIHTSKKNSNNPSEDYGTQSYVWAPTSQILDNQRSPTNNIGGTAFNQVYNVQFSAETPLLAIFTNNMTSGDYANTYLYSIVGIKYGNGVSRSPQDIYSETLLWENTTHAATPVNTEVTLLESYVNYDALYLVSEYNGDNNEINISTYPTSLLNTGEKIIINYDVGTSNNSFVQLAITSTTVLTVFGISASYPSHLQKVIGIKYGNNSTDDYTTTERKIGKWIDGSDLYQRTFEVTGLHNDGTYDDNILGTSNIVIRDWTGYLQYDTGAGKQHFAVQGYGSGAGDWIGCWTTTGCNDLSIRAKLMTNTYTLDKAVITIKYTKPSV